MRKLKLELADLRVDSFEVGTPVARGTVDARGKETFGCPTGVTCWGTCATCDLTCDTCGATCGGSCNCTLDPTCAATCASCNCSVGCTADVSCNGTCATCFAITCNLTVDLGRCCVA